jgi:hypothetical protein
LPHSARICSAEYTMILVANLKTSRPFILTKASGFS